MSAGLVFALACSIVAVLYGAGHDPLDPLPFARRRAHAGNRQGDPGRRVGLPEPAVHDDRRGRRGPGDPHRSVPRQVNGRRLRHRRRAVGRHRFHRHERLGARPTCAPPRRRGAASPRRSTWRSRAGRSPACWSSASACSASPAITHSCALAAAIFSRRSSRWSGWRSAVR